MPETPVISFLESIQFVVIRASFRVNFGVFVFDEYAFHGPLTVNKAAIANDQRVLLAVGPLLISLFAAGAHQFAQFIFDV